MLTVDTVTIVRHGLNLLGVYNYVCLWMVVEVGLELRIHLYQLFPPYARSFQLVQKLINACLHAHACARTQTHTHTIRIV